MKVKRGPTLGPAHSHPQLLPMYFGYCRIVTEVFSHQIGSSIKADYNPNTTDQVLMTGLLMIVMYFSKFCYWKIQNSTTLPLTLLMCTLVNSCIVKSEIQ